MFQKQTTLLMILSIILTLSAYGCGSEGTNPASPDMPSNSAMSESNPDTGSDTHSILGEYELYFDPETMTLEGSEVRSAEAHYNITPLIRPYVTFTLNLYDPVAQLLVFEMHISNPSVYYLYDLRGLFLSPSGSDYWLKNPDDYTKLFSPYPPDVVNPFRAYAKTAPNRVFAPGTNYTEKFEVRIPAVVTLPLGFFLRIECSWPGNCEEPYEISSQAISGPINSTTSANIMLNTFDHQNNIGHVYVDTTPITGGLTYLTSTTLDTWEGTVINSAGAAPGKYNCLITSDSWSAVPNLHDFITIEVIPDTTPACKWEWKHYPIPHGSCSMDLGVISDPGGTFDSSILMIQDDKKTCDGVYRYNANYTASGLHQSAYNYDPSNPTFQPWPIKRIDAADNGAFSFTNFNWSTLFSGATGGPGVYNAQIWTVFDRNPKCYLGPMPNDSRYWFDMTKEDANPYPADVCDDFNNYQYALFTTGGSYTGTDLFLVGVMPDSYTRDKVLYYANLDSFVGSGEAKVNNQNILGIDVYTFKIEVDVARLFILENNDGNYEVEVFNVMNSASGWGWDVVSYVQTIPINYAGIADVKAYARDIELLPKKNSYKLNPDYPTLCVLAGWYFTSYDDGEVLLYNSVSGAFIESIGGPSNPSLPHKMVQYLDTDDSDFEIHVTSSDMYAGAVATIFSYK